jgi:opacity protein-like surface antigen
MGDMAGLEIDLGYTPDFFNEAGDAIILVGDSNLTTFMGNLVVGNGGDGPVHPFFVAGVGLIRSRVDLGDLFQDVSTNDWGLAVGGGVTGMLSDHVGLRGEVRYFRSLEDPELPDPEDEDPFQVAIGKFDFWRATVGVVFRLP